MLYRRKKEKELESEEVDETTQTSSPGGGWQGRLSAFLHVHRGSRASSRKSSRASDASDLSELGGPWLNLPLLLLSSATNMSPEELDLTRESADATTLTTNQQQQPTTPSMPPPPPPPFASNGGVGGGGGQQQPPVRRRSIYNFPFFLRHQDAVEQQQEGATNTNMLTPAMAEDVKPKRGSIIKRKRGSSFKNKSTYVGGGNGKSDSGGDLGRSSADVSILVTEASPETAISRPILHRQHSESTVVQVLVHRESEEYRNEEEEAAEEEKQRQGAVVQICSDRITPTTPPPSPRNSLVLSPEETVVTDMKVTASDDVNS